MKIYLTEPVSSLLLDYIKNNHELVTDLSIAEIAISRNKVIGKNEIDNAKNLKLIAVHGTGYNMIDIDYAKKKNICVFNTPNLNTNAVAELNIMLMLNLARNYEATKKTRILGDINVIGSEIENKTIGFIGVGNIAIRTATILKSFNANLIGYNRTKKDTIIKLVSLEKLLNESDYIFITLALNSETRGMINKELFDKMQKSPYLINSARGGLINNNDLYEALKNNKIKGYASDVYDPEPISLDDPILDFNTIILPHVGANTKEALDKMAMAVIKGIDSFINKDKIDNKLV